MDDSSVDLYWLPVAAGTNSRVREWSLACWEGVCAFLARRPRAALYHPGLKVRLGDAETYTLELTPVFIGEPSPPLMTGPVGLRPLGRFRRFRYQLRRLRADALPDEEYAVASPVRLSTDPEIARQVLALGPSIPPHTWGLRAPGTSEMWTSGSAISWLLLRAGIELDGVRPPPGGRAPGWDAGIQLAGSTRVPVPSLVGAGRD